MRLLKKLAWRTKPREAAKPNDKAASEDAERPRMIGGTRVAKASMIMRGGR